MEASDSAAQAGTESSISSAQREGPRTIDVDFREIAEQNPGFAGAFFDEDHVLVIAVAADSAPTAARRGVLQMLGERTGAVSVVSRHRVMRTKYDYLELGEIRDRIRSAPDIVSRLWSVAIDPKSGVVRLRTASSERADQVRALIAANGFISDGISVEVETPPQPGVSLGDAIRPVTGGVKISSDSTGNQYCSVGLQAYKNDASGYPDASLGRFITTASHCAPPIGTVNIKLTFGQPNRAFGNHASEVDDAPIFNNGACPYSPAYCQYADVAVLKMYDSVPSTYQRVALSNTANPPAYLGSLSLNTSIWSAVAGQTVRKVGATSGQRDGTILTACDDLYLDGRWILCSAETSGYSAGGDSGGAVYTPFSAQTPGTPWRSGINHSGTVSHSKFWFSTLGSVLYALNGEYTM